MEWKTPCQIGAVTRTSNRPRRRAPIRSSRPCRRQWWPPRRRAPGTGTPTGTVTLAVTNRTPQVVTLVNGTASATFNPLQKGTHTVTANYNGNVNYATSSATTTQTVNTGQG
ncbi:Ig-like domain repeat protein [Streptomyces sp. NEAU-YJ-81]|nr:Ig-like domain repeat protein [Streptomyces sp. NEAU-YJ-81]